jgi:hypothetical protein
MLNNKVENTRRVLADDMRKYVQVILKEYGEAIPEERKEFLKTIDDYSSRIVIKDSGTISMYATEKDIIMPKGAYRIFKYMKMIPGYGINKKHRSYKEGEIVNKNTYYDYIKHVFISGMSVKEFFRDALLHETMHFCGSGGGKAIREGLTELKTRELAQKYGLKASRCGYPKEVDVVIKLQKIIGADILDKVAFAQDDMEIDMILKENCGSEVAKLFFDISDLMDKELDEKYDHSKFGGLFGPIKKAKAYSKIDYSNIYEKINDFEEKNKSATDNPQNQFIEDIRGDVLPEMDREPNIGDTIGDAGENDIHL